MQKTRHLIEIMKCIMITMRIDTNKIYFTDNGMKTDNKAIIILLKNPSRKIYFYFSNLNKIISRLVII